MPYIFYIPVFENMPDTDEIEIKGAATKAKTTEAVSMMSMPGMWNGYTVASVPKGASVTILSGTGDNTGLTELWNWYQNPYWFKVKYKGNTGYISAENLKFTVSRKLRVKDTYQLKIKSGQEPVWYDSSDPAIATVSATGKIKGAKKGTATIYAFTSSGIAAYTVKVQGEAKKITASTVKVGKVKAQAYTGKEIKPSVTVKDGKTTLKKGKHYTVEYSSNLWPGTATITIKGKGAYIGSRKVTFKITGTYKDYVTKAKATYYKAPGLSAKEMGSVEKGITVKVLTGYTKEKDGLTWMPVKIGGKYYYMASKYLKKK